MNVVECLKHSQYNFISYKRLFAMLTMFNKRVASRDTGSLLIEWWILECNY